MKTSRKKIRFRQYIKRKKNKKRQTVNDFEEKYLRLLADFENYKLRSQKEQSNFQKYANENLLTNLIGDLSLLKSTVSGEVSDPKINAYLSGFKMICEQIFNTLKEQGLQEINPSNEKFDPLYHEAIQSEANKQYKHDVITKVITPGYTLNGKVISYAKVKINKLNEGENNE